MAFKGEPSIREASENSVYPALRESHPVQLCRHPRPKLGTKVVPRRDTASRTGLHSRPLRKATRPRAPSHSAGSPGGSAAELHQILGTEASVKNALPEQLGQHKQIGPENQGSHKRRDLILKEDNISSLVPLNQHNYAEAFADSPPASLYPSPRYCSIGNNLISGGRRAGRERAVTAPFPGGCAPSKEPFQASGGLSPAGSSR